MLQIPQVEQSIQDVSLVPFVGYMAKGVRVYWVYYRETSRCGCSVLGTCGCRNAAMDGASI